MIFQGIGLKMKNGNPTTQSQAQLQFAQANTQFKNCNRACLLADAFLPTPKNYFFQEQQSFD
jgi:hypothetical protein